MADTRAGWLTVHEVLEVTGLSYQRVMDLVEEGRLTPEACGSTELFDPDAVAEIAATTPTG